MSDLQDRCEHWSRLDECPRGLSEASHAYQYGGFGTHELVMYYGLVRELLWSCWEQLTERAQSPTVGPWPDAFTVGDFLTTEVSRLERVREVSLDTPDPEFDGRTPRSIIARERARLPEGTCGHGAIIDPDCPCCQMMAEMPGPTFWHFDGSSMDDEFAFDIYHSTLEEWEEERRRGRNTAKLYDAEAGRTRATRVTDSAPREDGPWPSGGAAFPSATPPTCRWESACLVRLSTRRADRWPACRSRPGNAPPEAQRHIDQLNRDFGNLRDILQSSDASLAGALIDPVLHRFAETLDTAATALPTLRCNASPITDELHKLLNPPPRSRPGISTTLIFRFEVDPVQTLELASPLL